MKKQTVIVAAAAVAAAGAGGWFFWNKGQTGSQDETVYVTAISTLMGDVAGTQNRYAGVVEPQQTVNVKTESGRKIKEVKVKTGDAVKKGDVLFIYDESSSQDTLAQAELELERLKNEADSLASQIETLTKDKAEASADEQLSYSIEIQSAQMDLKKNEYNQKTKAAEIEKLKSSSKVLEVKSEIDGIIKKIDETVLSEAMDEDSTSSGSNSFITIVATGDYRVKGIVNETNVSAIVAGQEVIIRSRVDDSVTWSGTMTGIETKEPEKDNNADSYYGTSDDEQTTSSKYPFYVDLESTDGLMLGQHVYIEPDNGQGEQKDGIWLEDYFILDADTAPYVWASDENDRLMKRELTLGQYDEELGKYEIKEGLTKDDCIAFPAENCKEGAKTKVSNNLQAVAGEDAGMDSSFDSSGDEAGMDSSFDSSGEEGFDSSADSSYDSSMDSGMDGEIEDLLEMDMNEGGSPE